MRPNKSLVGMFLGCFLFVQSAHALNWEFAGWCGGGAYPAIVPDAQVPGRVFMLSDVAGMWRSDDRGNVWNFQTSALKSLHVASLAVSPSNPNILYLGHKFGVQRSEDGGTTWTYLQASSGIIKFQRPSNYRAVAIHPTDPNRVYVGTYTGEVYFTTDGGTTWNRLGTVVNPFNTTTPISSVHFTRDTRYLYIGNSGGLLRFNINSGVWENPGLAAGKVYDMVSHGTQPETLYVTVGKKVAAYNPDTSTWTYSVDLPITNGDAYRLSVTPGPNGMKILVGWRDGWSGGAYLSENAGASWTNIEHNLNYDTVSNPTRVWSRGFGWPLSIAFDRFDSSIFYFSDFWGVWRSDDNGVSWREKIKGAPNTIGSDVQVAPNGRIFVGSMDNGLLASSDGGATYTALAPNSGPDRSMDGHVWRVLLQQNGNRIVATNSPWDAGPNQVLISEDGGVTFTKTRNGLPTTYPVNANTVWEKGYARSLAVDPQNPMKLYLGIDGDGAGFYTSNDGGYNWVRSAGQPLCPRIYNGLAVDPTDGRRIFWGATGGQGGVYRSEDYGATWSKVFSGTYWVFDMAVGNDGTVYAATDTGGPAVYVSRNHGTSWSLLKKFDGTGACEAITPDPTNPLRVAVSSVKWDSYTPGRFYLTENGGTTWTEITENIPYGSGASAMAFHNNTLYMSRFAGGVFKMSLGGSSDTIPPTSPTGLSHIMEGTDVRLTWTASTDNVGVTGYRIFRDAAQIGTSPSNTYADPTATQAGTYIYTVQAYDAANNVSASSGPYSVVITNTDTTPPTAPTNLASALSNGGVELTWTASTDNVGVTKYDVYRGSARIGSSTTTVYNDSTVAQGVVYAYYVVALDAANNVSPSSNVTVITVTDLTAPSAPTNLRSTEVLSNSVVLAWNASTDNVGVEGYNVYRDDVLIGTSPTVSYADNTVTAGATYTYTVKAYDAAQNLSAASNTLTVDTPSLVITSYWVDILSSTSARINWQTNVAATGYVRYGLKSNDLSQQSTVTSPDTFTRVTLTDLQKNRTYYYQITVNASEASDQTNVRSFRTPRN